jgi:hypothetical protein
LLLPAATNITYTWGPGGKEKEKREKEKKKAEHWKQSTSVKKVIQ